MKRVVILGRGGAGESTLAARLGTGLGRPAIELDRYFWTSGLSPMLRDRWREVQREPVRSKRWIIDGDLGPADAGHARLHVFRDPRAVERVAAGAEG